MPEEKAFYSVEDDSRAFRTGPFEATFIFIVEAVQPCGDNGVEAWIALGDGGSANVYFTNEQAQALGLLQ